MAAAPNEDEHVQKVKDLLDGKVDDSEIDELSERIVSELKVGRWAFPNVIGVYCVQIVSIGRRQIKFELDGKPSDDFALVKFGHTSRPFEERYSELGVNVSEVFAIHSATVEHEKDLLKIYAPTSFKKGFYPKGTHVATIEKALKIGEGAKRVGPAITEWRILTKKVLVLLKAGAVKKADDIKTFFTPIIQAESKPVTVQVGALKILLGVYKVENLIELTIPTILE